MKANAKKPYFQGVLSDGDSKLRFVGWSSAKEKLLQKFQHKSAVSFSNCSIRPRDKRFGDGLEIHLNDKTIIEKAEKTL